jgi:signal transduction histidine kinase
VQESNDLLAAQDQSLARARARAADLAHGLKTPLAVLQSDADRLRAGGQHEIADEIGEVAAQMRRHVERELARARLRAGGQQVTALQPVAERMVTFFKRLPRGQDLIWTVDIDANIQVAADGEDLTELLGNLLENACKWAAAAVTLVAESRTDSVLITVLDDGPGVPGGALTSLTGRGVRLDQKMPGTGLGLAIAQDIAEACGGSLTFSNRPEGGFAAVAELPSQQKSSTHA